MVNVTKDIFYVGVNDHNIDLFEYVVDKVKYKYWSFASGLTRTVKFSKMLKHVSSGKSTKFCNCL